MITIKKDEYMFLKTLFPQDVARTRRKFYLAEMDCCLQKLKEFQEGLTNGSHSEKESNL